MESSLTVVFCYRTIPVAQSVDAMPRWLSERPDDDSEKDQNRELPGHQSRSAAIPPGQELCGVPVERLGKRRVKAGIDERGA